MNIHQIIVEEVDVLLRENENAEVLKGLDELIHQVRGGIPELEKVVADNILPYISSTLGGSLKEGEEDEESSPVRAKAATVAKGAAGTVGYVLSHLPLGKKLGVMIATALDTTTEDHVRNAVLFALGNLIAGQMGLELPDLGHLLQEIPETMWEMLPFTDDNQEWDWGAINALDDAALVTWAWVKVQNAVDVQEKLHEFGKFIGRSNLGKQPEPAVAGGFEADDMSLDAKAARAAAARESGKKFRGIKETTIRKSEIYKMIKEEVEVVLTNEEANEMFDLDMSALLDEMMGEGMPFMKDVERARRGELPPEQARRIQAASSAMETRAGDPGRTSQSSEEDDPKERPLEDLEEKKLSSKERKDLSSSSFIFPKERKFPIPDESHGRNALSRANQYSSAPSWYDGSLESLVKRVHSAVKKKFPGIETTPASAKPGKG